MKIEPKMWARTVSGVEKINNVYLYEDNLMIGIYKDSKLKLRVAEMENGKIINELDWKYYFLKDPSHDILDSLDCGDFVNDFKIKYIDKSNNWVNWSGCDELLTKDDFRNMINSIVTKDYHNVGKIIID